MRWLRDRSGGQVLVIVALSATMLIAMVGMAVDGGYMFDQRRAAQNAADAATLAGVADIARAYGGDISITGGAGGTVATDVTTNVNGNGSGTPTWYFIDNANSNEGQTLDTTSGTGVTGITVRVQKTFSTFFIRILPGLQTLTVGATASGHLQALAGGGGPFLVCANAIDQDTNPLSGFYDLTPNPPVPNPVMVWKTPAPAAGTPTPPVVMVHGPHLEDNNGNCGYGNGSEFKGVEDASSPSCPSVPCYANGNKGDTVNPLSITLANATNCNVDGSGKITNFPCVAVLPIVAPYPSTAYNQCSPPATPQSVAGGTIDNLCVRAFGVFMIDQGNNPSNCPKSCTTGKLLGPAIATSGSGSTFTPGQGGALLVKISS